MYATGCKMALLRNLLVLVALLANSVFCEHKQDPICIYTEGGKVCSSAESAELSHPEDASAVLEAAGLGQPAADSAGSALAPAEGAASVKAADGANDAGVEDSNAEPAAPDAQLSNQTATNSSSRASSDVAAQSSTSVEESSRVGDEGHTSDQGNAPVADANTSTQDDSGEAAEVNGSKQENSSFSAVTNTTMQGSSVNDAANVSSAQNGSVEVSGTNESKQSYIDVVESNTTKQENAVSTVANATMDENSRGVNESNTSKTVSIEAATNSGNSSVVDAEGNASHGISANSSVPSSDVLSNSTEDIQIPEHTVAKNQTSENATTEGQNRNGAVATAEGQETADSSETGARAGDNALSQSKEAITDVSSPELLAVAEGLVMAGAVLEVATATRPPAARLDPAQEVALAEGLEMADAVLQAVKEDEPAVNAIWRATLEAETRMKQDDSPVDEQTLDKGLMAFLVCVMTVLVVTGSVSGWVLYTRLRRTPEEDQAQNMYILIDASDPQSTFVDCPLDLNDSEGVSYTFPRVVNDTLS